MIGRRPGAALKESRKHGRFERLPPTCHTRFSAIGFRSSRRRARRWRSEDADIRTGDARLRERPVGSRDVAGRERHHQDRNQIRESQSGQPGAEGPEGAVQVRPLRRIAERMRGRKKWQAVSRRITKRSSGRSVLTRNPRPCPTRMTAPAASFPIHLCPSFDATTPCDLYPCVRNGAALQQP